MSAKDKQQKENGASKNRNISGIISVTSRGVGYLPHEDFEEDIEIQPGDMNTALHGDSVEVFLHPKEKNVRQRGEVVSVTGRANTRFIGVLERENGHSYLVPDYKKMYVNITVPQNETKDIPENTKVLVEMEQWDNPKKQPRGHIIDVIGKKGEHETEMQAALIGHGFELDFPKAVEEEARELEGQPAVTDKDREKRRDMRDVPTFTIDPDTAKDFDDALSVRELENGNLEVGVHIADVSHFVKEGSAIDKEAQERGTSVYLVDRTIPMLPEILSNDLCSLRPEEERLAFSIIFELDKNGEVQDEWIGEVVIHSDTRFTYRTAQDVLDSGSGPHVKELKAVNAIAERLRKERIKEGAIAFEQDEVAFELDEDGKPVRVYRKEMLPTNHLIEEFMLLANRRVAQHFYKQCVDESKNAAFIYRIHDVPNPEKIEDLGIFLRAIGYEFESKGGNVTAKDINKLFEKIEGTPEEELIKTATIRSMAKAIYSTKNIGHFGLAFKYYTHFTSPIRRYPDLAVHRILKHHLNGEPISSKEFAKYERIALQSSEREAAALEAERDSVKYKQVEYLSEHIGEAFDAKVSGVTEWGIFVQENETKAEGMVRLGTLKNDYYTLDKKHYRMEGADTGQTYALGDDVRVKLIGANLDDRQLDFKIIS